MKLIRYGLPLLAALALGYGIATTLDLAPEMEVTRPVYDPPGPGTSGARVYGLGVVEPPGGVVSVTSPLSGIVAAIAVVPGDRVAKGDVLFVLDDSEVAADVAIRRAALEAKRAELAQMKAGAHPEAIRAEEHRVEGLKTNVERAQDAFERVSRLAGQGALAQDDYRQKRFALEIEKAEHARVRAELSKLRAGPRRTDLEVLERQIVLEESQLDRALVNLRRTVVRAPMDALVVRVNLRRGEFISTDFASESSVVLAADGPLTVKVQITEEEVGRIRPGIPAEAAPRGRSGVRIPLRFLRIEPYVTSKKEFSGKSTERLDARVFAVIYEMEAGEHTVYAGQYADVFITIPDGE